MVHTNPIKNKRKIVPLYSYRQRISPLNHWKLHNLNNIHMNISHHVHILLPTFTAELSRTIERFNFEAEPYFQSAAEQITNAIRE